MEINNIIQEDHYPVNNFPTIDKIRMYDDDNTIYYRFQMPEWEMGTKSWGMIYDSEEEALENGGTVTEGKSACEKARFSYSFYSDAFGNTDRMLILKGYSLGRGPDQEEELVVVEEILEIWSYRDFCNLMEDVRQGMYDEEEEEEEEYIYVPYQI
ncbi:MAG TPA: hypothetical protein DEG71_09865 [Clostridiales bacterium]|nr:hypothetical protein [Clostridiales bacterium]